jgi:hypothetical protein
LAVNQSSPWPNTPNAPAPPLPSSLFSIGLDLGQSRDFSALAVIELANEAQARPERDSRHPTTPVARLRLRHLHRWSLGTGYTDIVRDLQELLSRAELHNQSNLVVDATGVGAPVIEFLWRAGLRATPVLITAGETATIDERGWWHTPKRDLVSSLAIALESGALQIAHELRYSQELRRELANFRAKISLSGNDTYSPWREGTHDDLVLATALAVWHLNRGGGHWTTSHSWMLNRHDGMSQAERDRHRTMMSYDPGWLRRL